MGQARNERRLAKKNSGNALGNMLGRSIADLKGLVSELRETQYLLGETLVELDEARYEITRQRTVFLRLLTCGGLTACPVEELLEREEQFRAEYDAIAAFVILARNLQTPEAEPES